jgi:hypothetical protein
VIVVELPTRFVKEVTIQNDGSRALPWHVAQPVEIVANDAMFD